jgi:hypothetical protein
MVVIEIRRHESLDVPCVEQDHVVEKFSVQRPHGNIPSPYRTK